MTTTRSIVYSCIGGRSTASAAAAAVAVAAVAAAAHLPVEIIR